MQYHLGHGKGGHPFKFHPPGTAPGTLHIDLEAKQPVIRAMAYGPDALIEREISDLDELSELRETHPCLWVEVVGLGDSGTIDRLGELFDLHRLALEDVMHRTQRPKLDPYESHLFLILRIAVHQRPFSTEQVALFLGQDYVLTCQEHGGDCFDVVRTRLRDATSRIRRSGPDYLAYALLDASIDSYFPAMEHYGDYVDDLERRIFTDDSEIVTRRIHVVKRDLLLARRAIWPQRDVVNQLVRDEHSLVTNQTRVFLRDCYDHVVQLMEITETYREITSDLVDINLSQQSQRMNEVMKVLTVIATIFIPLGTIAGIYGMNFHTDASPWNMPELGWRFGYFYALGLMFAIGAGMVYFFWRKGWIWRRRHR